MDRAAGFDGSPPRPSPPLPSRGKKECGDPFPLPLEGKAGVGGTALRLQEGL